MSTKLVRLLMPPLLAVVLAACPTDDGPGGFSEIDDIPDDDDAGPDDDDVWPEMFQLDPDADGLLGGTSASERFGSAVAGLDADGDGVGDVAVASAFWNDPDEEDPAGGQHGRVSVFFGGGLADAALTPDSADVLISGTTNCARFGTSLTVIPDLDGDLRDELLVGAVGCGHETAGVYLFLGQQLAQGGDLEPDDAHTVIMIRDSQLSTVCMGSRHMRHRGRFF